MKLRSWKIWSPLFALGLAAGGTRGADYTWNDTTGNWSNSGQWTGGVPISDPTTRLFFGSGIADYTSTFDLPTAFQLNAISLTAATGRTNVITATTLTNTLDFVVNGATQPQLSMSGGGTFRIANNVRVADNTNLTFSVATGSNLVFSQAATSGGAGAHSIAPISGTNATVTVDGGGTVVWRTITSQNIAVNNGLLLTDADGDFLGAGNVTVGAQGTIDTGGFGEGWGSISGAAGAVFRGGVNVNAASGTYTYAGIITNRPAGVAVPGFGTVGGAASTGSLTKSGGHTLILSGANTYTGTSTISGGTLVLAVDAVSTGSAGGFPIGPAASITSGPLGTGAVTLAGGATLTVSGSNRTLPNALALSGTSATPSIIDVPTGLELTTTGLITGGATIVVNKTGPGLWRTTAASTGFTGTVNINLGSLLLTDVTGGTAATGGDFNPVLINVNNGGNFTFGTNPAYSGENPDLPASTYVTVNTGGTVTWNIGEDFGGINMLGGAVSARGNMNFTGGTVSDWRSGTISTLSGTPAIGGAGIITKTTSGTVTITGVNLNNTGGLNIQEGAISTNAGIIATGNLTFGTSGAGATGGTLQYTGASGSLAKPIAVNDGGGTIEITQASTTLTYSSSASGPGAIVKAGPGTLALTATSTYTGGTSVTAGTLQIGLAGATGALAGPINLSANATLAINRTDNFSFANNILGAGNLTQAGPNILTLTGTLSHTGLTTVSAGTLRVPSYTAGPYSVADSTTLSVIYSGTPTTMTLPNLTLGTAAGATLKFELNSVNPTVPLINVTAANGLVANGVQTLAVVNSQAFTVGTFSLIQYAGSAVSPASFQLGTLPARTLGNLDFTTANRINLAITGVDSIKWKGNLSSNWDTGTAINVGGTLNFTLNSNGSATNFVVNDTVLFDDTATAGSFTVGIAADVLPSSVTVNNSLANPYTFQGTAAIAGSASLVKLGTGTLNLLTNNTYTGPTTVSAGSLVVGNGSTTGSIGTGDLTINGSVTFNRSDDIAFGGAVSGTGGMTKSGTNILTFTGPYTLAGTTTISGGSLVLDTAADYVLPGVLTGAGAFTKAGTGNISLTGDWNHTGGTTINGGTLTVGNGSPTGSIAGNVSIASALGTLAFNRTSTYTYAGNIDGAGRVLQAGTGKTTLTGNLSYVGSTTVNTGTLEIIVPAATVQAVGNYAINVAGSLILDVATGNSFNIGVSGTSTNNNTVSGSGTFIKNGGGTVTLSSASTGFSGTQIINGGLFLLGDPLGSTANSSGDLNSTSIIINNGGKFQFGIGGVTGENPDLPDTTYITVNTGGELIWRVGEQFGGVNLTGGLITLNGGSIGGLVGTTPMNWTSGTVNGLTAQTINGTNIINKTTSGTVTVTGSASITTPLNILDGTVVWVTAANVGSGNLTFGSTTPTTGTLEYQGATVTRAGTVGLTGPAVVRVTDAAAVLTMSGVFSGAGSLTKDGLGTLLLTATNTYTGGTTISQGTLQVGAAGTVGVLPGNVTNNAALVFNRTNALTYAGVIGGTGTLAQAGTGTLILTGNSSYSGGTTVTAGILQAGNTAGSATGTGNVTVASGATLQGTGFIVPTGTNKVVINGGRIKGGASPGVLTVGDGTTSGIVDINANSTYVIDLRTTAGLFAPGATGTGASGIGGADNSRVTVLGAGGQLNFNAIGSLTVKVNGDAAGTILDPTASYSFLVGSASTVTAFSTISGTIGTPGQFDFTGLANSANLAGNTFSFVSVGNNVYLEIAPVPEPGCLLIVGAAGLAWYRRRRA